MMANVAPASKVGYHSSLETVELFAYLPYRTIDSSPVQIFFARFVSKSSPHLI